MNVVWIGRVPLPTEGETSGASVIVAMVVGLVVYAYMTWRFF